VNKNQHYGRRFASYLFGLFIMTIGIAVSVKSNLGVSPVSSIPYTMTCVWGIEMGRATIIFHCFLVLFQIVLLRRHFKLKNLLQIAVGVVFGYFTTFGNWTMHFLPAPSNLAVRLMMVGISSVIVAAGIFFYLPPDIMPLAGEGVMKAVSDVTGIEFSKVKIGFDVSMVVISFATCMLLLHRLGSVGIGTIIAAFLVGSILGQINKAFGAKRDRWLYPERTDKTESSKAEPSKSWAITIAREYGSGGRTIGKKIAEDLGIAYYDLEIINQVAKASGVAAKVAEANDETIGRPFMHSLYFWAAGTIEEDELPVVERIFDTQEKIILELAEKGPCVIVGRLGNFILKDKVPHFSAFVSAGMPAKVKMVTERDGLDAKAAQAKIEKVERERANHCQYFTHQHWKDLSHYDFAVRSDEMGLEQTSKMIETAAKAKLKFA
jgi:uncharacterized membrane protein YczE/cytidylate kinase